MLEGGGEPIASIPASYQTVHTHRGHVDCTATTRRAHRGRRTARAAATTDGAGMHDHGPSTRDADSGPGSVAQGPPSDPARVACAPLMQHETATRWPSSTPRVHATASVRREPSPSSEATPTHTRADPRRRTTSMLHQAQTAARPTAHLCAVARCSETM